MINSRQFFPPQCTQSPELKYLVSEIVEELPSFKYTSLANSEIDYYGASYNIAHSLGLEDIPFTRASWHHGWNRYPLVTPELFIHEDCVAFCEVKKVPNLVATPEIEAFLKANDYPHATAVGDPFIYTKKPSMERIPNSILIVPEHSTKERNAHYEKLKSFYLPENPDVLKSRFSMIAACLSGFCVLRNNYLDFYEKSGIPWITGAWLNDAYALQRIRNLFSQFEYVATNAIGTHIPYAGYCGCKLIYYGKGKNINKKDLVGIPIYDKYPQLIDIIIHEQKLETTKKRFPFLFQANDDFIELKEWSMQVLGAQNQLPPEDIAKLIGWKIRQKGENSWEYIPEANPGLVTNN